MKAINCPQCGAPAKVEDVQTVYTCPYCNRSFETGKTPPKKEPAPRQQVIVVQAPGSARRSGGGAALIGSLVMVFGIAGAAYFLTSNGAPVGLAMPSLSWDGKSALECGGNDNMTIENVTTTLPGTAVIVDGNCHLKLVNCHIKADTVFELSGNAQVRLEGGTFEGETAIDASGNSVVRIAGATVTGKRKHRANARIDGK